MSRAGSSPRLRGTQNGQLAPDRAARFIPAVAGNAKSCPRSRCSRPVHPRGCGERSTPIMKGSAGCGSSPRLRGTRAGFLAGHLRVRFIPAVAGNAASSGAICGTTTVHPRGCGERTCWNSLPFRLFFCWPISTKKIATSLHGGQAGLLFSFRKKGTSLLPSISTGIRLFFPNVRKSRKRDCP